MGSKRRWVSRSTSTSPLDGTCVAGMLTGPAGQGDVAEAVLGIGGVVVVSVVVTVGEATLGLAARISVIATAANAPILRTERIMAPTVGSAGSRTTPGRDDNSYIPMAAEVGMRTLADGRTD